MDVFLPPGAYLPPEFPKEHIQFKYRIREISGLSGSGEKDKHSSVSVQEYREWPLGRRKRTSRWQPFPLTMISPGNFQPERCIDILQSCSHWAGAWHRWRIAPFPGAGEKNLPGNTDNPW